MHFYLMYEKSLGGNSHVLGLGGEFDMRAAPMLEDRVDTLVEQGTRHLEIDMRETTFMDSSGVRALLSIHKKLEERGGSLELMVDDPHLLRVIDFTGLHEIITVRSSFEDGVLTLGQTA
jgi:anti-sigma B factor antagonist